MASTETLHTKESTKRVLAKIVLPVLVDARSLHGMERVDTKKSQCSSLRRSGSGEDTPQSRVEKPNCVGGFD